MNIIKNIRRKWFEYRVDHCPQRLLEGAWRVTFGYPLDLDNPLTLNEKIQWLICRSNTSEWTRLSDKILVRDFVSEKGLSDMLVPLLGTWNDANDINFDQLPEKFVLKCNHDSGSVFIIDKNKPFDWSKIVNTLNAKLKEKSGYKQIEPHYNNIHPQILAEAYLDLDTPDISSSCIDYKIFCYNGEPDVVLVTYNRHTGEFVEHQVRDLDWTLRPEYGADDSYYRLGDAELPCPESLESMIRAARILSNGFPQVRVDFYDVKGKAYFGELTFTSDCGRMPYFSNEYQIIAGSKIDLTLAQKK